MRDTHLTTPLDTTGRRAAASRNARRLALLFGGFALLLLMAACGTVQAPVTDGLQLLVTQQASSIDAKDLDGTTIDGTVTVLVRDNPRIQAVDFYLDDPGRSADPSATANASPFQMDLDTTALADGSHTLTAVAAVDRGQPKVVTSTFTVSNGGAPAPDPSPAPSPDPTPTPGGGTFRTIPPATLYVDPAGDDGNDGRTPQTAFRTVQHAADVVQPGDVVYLRGGVYPIRVRFSHSGTASDPIVWASYPGEWAVFDGSNETPASSTAKVLVSGASWNVFANFEVRSGPQEGVFVDGASDNIFSNLWTHGNFYSGITNYGSDRNRYEYIVSFDNYDVTNPSGRYGDDADGMSISSGDGNVVYASIVFNNSDDGIDTWRSTNTLVDHVISHDNGRGAYGNGNGIKAGGNGDLVHTVVRNSIAFNNRGNGFDENSGRDVHFLNDTSFANGGYAFTGGSTTVLRNNLAYGSDPGLWGSDSQHNSWDLGIADPGFASTDPSQAGFLSLRSDSAAIDAGMDVGLPYGGSAPDLGALPYQSTYASLIDPLTVTADELIATAPGAATLLASR